MKNKNREQSGYLTRDQPLLTALIVILMTASYLSKGMIWMWH